ncbi:MAG: hypothetical protein HY300_20575, partial [Verrucomicrobia bacterium]|nr:hypothetical protein [Verrucomicrobiota bacterium]
ALCVASSACKKKAAEQAAATEEQAAQPKEEPPVELKVKWPVGKRFVMNNEMSQETTVQNPAVPTPIKIEMSQGQEMALSVVKEREGGGREVEVEFLGFKLDMRQPGQPPMRFDSKSDPKSDTTNVVAKSLRKFVGAKLKYLTDATGKVEKVEGVDDLLKKLLAGSSITSQAILRGMMTEENFKRMVVTAAGLPDKPVKVGESWPVNTTVPGTMFGTLVLDMNYKFNGLQDHAGRKCAALEYTGTVTNVLAKPATAAPQNAAAAPTMEDGKTSGQAWFDPALGMMIESSGEQSFTIKRTVQTGTFSSETKQKTTSRIIQISALDGSAVETLQTAPKPAQPKADAAKSAEAKTGDMKTPAATAPTKQ